MNPGIALVLLTKLNLQTFLPLSRDILGYSAARAADGVSVELKEIPHNIACIAAFKDEKNPPTFRPDCPHLKLFQAGFLIAADERDMSEILELAAMPFVLTQTMSRGVDAVVVSGTLAAWRDAITLACSPRADISRETRHTFNAAYKILCKEGLRDMFGDLHVSEQPDHTFLLQHHR
jgi:hypothetical protein